MFHDAAISALFGVELTFCRTPSGFGINWSETQGSPTFVGQPWAALRNAFSVEDITHRQPETAAVVFYRLSGQNRNAKRLGGTDSGLIFIGNGTLAAESIDQLEISA